jgi:cbb3-type cytochrome oxidase subunit 3
MKKITQLTQYGAGLISLALSPVLALAQTSDNINLKVSGQFGAITSFTPSQFITTAINIILIAAAIIAFFFLLIGGIQWILAGGNKEGTENARKKITSALIGLAIVFSAYAIAFIIQALFGIDIFRFDLKKIGSY